MSWNKIIIYYTFFYHISIRTKIKLSFIRAVRFFLSYVSRLVVITHISFDTLSAFTKAAHDTWKSLKILSIHFCNEIALISIHNSFIVMEHLISYTHIDDILLFKYIDLMIRLMLSNCLWLFVFSCNTNLRSCCKPAFKGITKKNPKNKQTKLYVAVLLTLACSWFLKIFDF